MLVGIVFNFEQHSQLLFVKKFRCYPILLRIDILHIDSSAHILAIYAEKLLKFTLSMGSKCVEYTHKVKDKYLCLNVMYLSLLYWMDI